MITAYGETLTRGSVWLALGCYAFAVIVGRFGCAGATRGSVARWLWTVGSLALAAHLLAAFAFYHHASHAEAYRHTAERTKELIGLDWGGGLYFNYLMTAFWLSDAAWWWRNEHAYRTRPQWLNQALHAYFAFMAFNATVVFETGAVRAWGLAGSAALVLAGFLAARRKVS